MDVTLGNVRKSQYKEFPGDPQVPFCLCGKILGRKQGSYLSVSGM